MKTLYFALGFCAFAATGCIIESHPANSTPETPAGSASAAGTTTAAPTTTTTPPPAPKAGVPPPMREAPKQ